MRIVIKLKMGVVANVVLNSLYKYTAMQSSFSVNNIALVDGRPRLLNLKKLIKYFVRHRHQVVVRRARFERDQATKRAHILEGLLKALDILDEVIALIRASQTVEEARNGLQEQFGFTTEQASAIVEMRLRQLTGLERSRLQAEYDQLMALIRELEALLASEALQMNLIKEELLDLKERFNDPRRTEIDMPRVILIGRFLSDEDVVITISHLAIIKRTNLNEYRLQGRGVWAHAEAIRGKRISLSTSTWPICTYYAVLHTERQVLLAESIRDSGRKQNVQGQGYSERYQHRARRQRLRIYQREEPDRRRVHQQQLHHPGYGARRGKEDDAQGVFQSAFDGSDCHYHPGR